MTEEFNLPPYVKDTPCETCGSHNYAHAKLSPVTMKPISCDQCPPKRIIVHPQAGSQEIQ